MTSALQAGGRGFESHPVHMKKETILKIASIIAVAGLLFSGYLSYIELSGQGSSCTLAKSILGLPTCVYGFVMYAIILALLLVAARKH